MKNRMLGVLGKKLLLLFLTISLIPALILSYINYIHSKRLLETELFNELSLVGEALAEHIKEFLLNGENTAKHFSSDGFIREHMEKIIDFPKNTTISQELSTYLEYKTKLEPRFRETYTTNPQGIVVASSNGNRIGVNLSKDLLLWKAKGSSFVKDAHFCKTTGEYSLIFYSPINHKDTNIFMGLIGIRILASELESITVGKNPGNDVVTNPAVSHQMPGEKNDSLFLYGQTYFKPSKEVGVSPTSYGERYMMQSPMKLTTLTRRGKTSEAYLVNKHKYMLTSSRFIDNVQLKQRVNTIPVNTLIDEGKETAGIYKDYRGISVIGVSKYLKDTDWILLVETDVSEAFKPVYRARGYSIAIILASISIISVSAFFVSHKITNPVKLLTSATGKISKGERVHPIQITSKDEIGELTGAFNRMTIDLVNTRSELRDLFDGANDPMVTLKDDNTVNNINSRVSELFGYTSAHLLNKKITSIVRIDDVPRVEKAIEKTWLLKPGEKLPTLEIGVVGKQGGVLICELDLNRTRFGIQPHFRNITERKLLEETLLNEKEKLEESNAQLQTLLMELKKTQSQLFQSEKMASIGQLAAGIAHEINNPVGYISSNLELLQNKFNTFKTLFSEIKKLKPESRDKNTETTAGIDPKKEIDYITKSISESLEGTKRIKNIVNALSTFTHRGDNKLKLMNINTEIENILNIIWNEIKYKSRLVKNYGDIPMIMCNQYQLGQAFMNIIMNALQAIKEMGEIKITTYRKGNYLYVEISDNGIGIPARHLSKIFEPFFTTKEVGKGTGLGLSITYNIIKSHYGTIEVSSKVNEGTTFTIKLPVNNYEST